MDSLIRAEADAGFFTRAAALAAGHSDNSIERAVRSREWTRIRPGAYAVTSVWESLSGLQRHEIATRAVLTKLGPRVALSHVSAAVVHGLDLWRPDLGTVHVTRLDGGAGRTESGIQHHEGLLVDGDTLAGPYGRTVTPVRAAVETAHQHSTEQGVVVLDSLLRSGAASSEELAEALALLGTWPSARHVQVAGRLADGRAASVGESRSRYCFFAQGLPAPVLQFAVHDGADLVGICDFAWPEHRLLGEFDGRTKYERHLRPGETPSDAVVREKIREDRLREVTGWGMVRLTWADLDHPRTTADRLRRMLSPRTRVAG